MKGLDERASDIFCVLVVALFAFFRAESCPIACVINNTIDNIFENQQCIERKFKNIIADLIKDFKVT